MELYKVYEKIHKEIESLRYKIYQQRLREQPDYPTGIPPASWPGNFGVAVCPHLLKSYTDEYLLELIYKALTELKELQKSDIRIHTDKYELVEKYRHAILSEIPNLSYLVEEEWELQ